MLKMNYSMQKQKLGKSHSMYFPRGIKHVNERHYYTVTSLKRLSLFFIHKGIMEPAEPVHTGESQGFMKEGNMGKTRLKAEKNHGSLKVETSGTSGRLQKKANHQSVGSPMTSFNCDEGILTVKSTSNWPSSSSLQSFEQQNFAIH